MPLMISPASDLATIVILAVPIGPGNKTPESMTRRIAACDGAAKSARAQQVRIAVRIVSPK